MDMEVLPQGEELLNKIYPPRFFGRRYRLKWRAEIMAKILKEVFELSARDRVVDLGCATGDLVAELRDLNIEAYGLEGSKGAQPFLVSEHVHFVDLTHPTAIKNWHIINANLVTSFEVFEHIAPKHAEILVDNTCLFNSEFIAISAAGVDQRGHYHVNCRPQEYWIQKFIKRGYELAPTYLMNFKDKLFPYSKKRAVRAYYANLIIFKRSK